jgi:hypothetical protein
MRRPSLDSTFNTDSFKLYLRVLIMTRNHVVGPVVLIVFGGSFISRKEFNRKH